MHSHTVERWTHDHAFLGQAHERNERRTLVVVTLTAGTMIAEIIGGRWFNSMALFADGWHMSTHVLALGIATFAYRYARLHSRDPQFAFGTGKLGELAGFASATILALVALLIGYDCVLRLVTPLPIAFGEAIPIATLGLFVNLVSAALLHGGGGGHHGHEHGRDPHSHRHHDHSHDHPASHARHRDHDGRADTNMRAAYLHVAADALTSLLAIAALLAGSIFGWMWLDPVIGIVGAGVIVSWAVSLVRSAGAVLLDLVPSPDLARSIREAVEVEGDRIADLHLWRLGPGHAGVILSVVTDHDRSPDDYKHRLVKLDGLSHVTVEVNHCEDHSIAA